MFLIFGTTDLNTISGGGHTPLLIKTMGKKFRSPVYLDDDYLYITESQLRFYMNGLDEPVRLSEILSDGMVSKEFMDYYEKCVAYNLIWDLSEKFPKSSTMYWDEGSKEFKIVFPKSGMVARCLKKHGLKTF
tara:strand:- start:190 stop:585 length:396 start_codon:yes stop_codon:yes gene_type:complete